CRPRRHLMRTPVITIAPLFVLAGAVVAGAQPSFRPSGGSAAPDNLRVETVAKGLSFPWAIAFLPDSRMLVTERAGRMRIVARDGQLSPAITNVPAVVARGQGGLHDV